MSVFFDATEVKPDEGFDGAPLPAGKYQVIIVKSEMKPTSKNDGRYLSLEFQVLDGQFKNRRLWENFNLENKNAETVKIARAQLSAVCHAVGVMKPSGSHELHNIPMWVTVGHKKDDRDGTLKNRITKYESREKVAHSQAVANIGQQPGTPAASAASTPPWKKPAAA